MFEQMVGGLAGHSLTSGIILEKKASTPTKRDGRGCSGVDTGGVYRCTGMP
jgi:hypothetical protein